MQSASRGRAFGSRATGIGEKIPRTGRTSVALWILTCPRNSLSGFRAGQLHPITFAACDAPCDEPINYRVADPLGPEPPAAADALVKRSKLQQPNVTTILWRESHIWPRKFNTAQALYIKNNQSIATSLSDLRPRRGI